MNARKLALAVAVVGMLCAAVFATDGRAHIGIRLDPSPLPDLLTKHLGLKPGQGIRISNISVGSPADRTGLDRDDIVIRFQGQDVNDLDRFVEAVRAAGVGTEVSLEVIHLGQRKTLEFELEAYTDNPGWKFSPEPEVVTSWRPGRLWRIGPDGREWMEIPFNQIPEANREIKRFFNQLHTYRHSTDGEDYTITIEGDPTDEDSKVTVHADDTEYSATVGQLDTLPEAYREPAREAVESAKKSSRVPLAFDRLRLPQPPKPEVYRRYFQDLTIPRPSLEQWSEKKDQLLEELTEQMKQLQERIEQLEQRHQEALRNLLDQDQEDSDAGDDAATGGKVAPDAQAKPTV